MAEFTVNTARHDPYKRFRFRVRWDGQFIPGISHVSALRRTTAAVTYRSGGDSSHTRVGPGLTSFEPITLERGVTHDPAFESWADRVYDLDAGSGAQVSLGSFRKDVRIELLNEAGQLVIAYQVFRAWPSMYEPITDLDAASSSVAREVLVLQHEGWMRDASVPEPTEPR